MSTSVVLRRRLASELRALRHRASLSQEEVALHLGSAVSKIVRIESAQSTVSVSDLRAMLDIYEATDPELRDRLIDLARNARKRGGWWSAYRDLLPGPYVALEAEASEVRNYEPSVIPGLLQTEDYARAFISSSPRLNTEEVERRVAARMHRQQRLYTDPLLQVRAVLDEAVLHRPAGRAETMRAQLGHLIELGELPNVGIQVLPQEIGLYPAIGYPFVIVGFPPPDPDIVLIETRVGEHYLHEAHEIAVFATDFDHLRDRALDEHGSATLIKRLIEE
ncbi:helix-turn-helix domain-containing protein [Actinomadura scrupuli]|uniref:helix-turn-helix domain-containing protein n=1 Tax=Actinomadura scrupuli TaxID=559629 RepID=UPI003D971C8E